MQIMNPAQPESTINDQNGISSHPNGYEKTAPVSAELKTENGYRKSPEHDVHADDFTGYSKEISKDSVAASGAHAENLLADSVIYTDKNILESDLPELIVCYQDSTFHDVKDICVDEGMPAEDKCLTDNLVSGNNTLPSKNFRHTELTEEADTDISYEEDFKSSPYKDFRENDSAEGVDKGEDNLDKDTAYNGDSFQQKSSPESNKDQNSASVLTSQIQTDKEEFTAVDKTDEIAFNTPTSSIQTGELECNAIDKTAEIVRDSTLLSEDLCGETSLESLLKSAKGGEDKSSQQSDEISGAHESPVRTEASNRNSLDDLLDSGVISFNVESSKLSPITIDEIDKTAIAQQLKSEKKLINDDGISDSRLVINDKIKRDQGESSFSVAGPLADAVPYSGHVPFSGSISLRSDSSTTSTRSFAFPVLPNEWNSSPVRMAKADRRNYRRQRGCFSRLLCCRF
ncbi:hypothetical protein ACET3Z_031897 [Daucus carota]